MENSYFENYEEYLYLENKETYAFTKKLYHDIELSRHLEIVKSGDINSAFFIFRSYMNSNNKKAFDYLKIGADGGHKDCQFFTGMFHYYGFFDSGKDYNEAFKWILKSALNNNKAGMYVIHKFYEYGIGTTIDKEKSSIWEFLYDTFIPKNHENFKHLNYYEYMDFTETESERWLRKNIHKLFN